MRFLSFRSNCKRCNKILPTGPTGTIPTIPTATTRTIPLSRISTRWKTSIYLLRSSSNKITIIIGIVITKCMVMARSLGRFKFNGIFTTNIAEFISVTSTNDEAIS